MTATAKAIGAADHDIASGVPAAGIGRYELGAQWSLTEKVLLGRLLIFIGVFLLAGMTFGYAGVIVMAVISAVAALFGLVFVTATGLR